MGSAVGVLLHQYPPGYLFTNSDTAVSFESQLTWLSSPTSETDLELEEIMKRVENTSPAGLARTAHHCMVVRLALTGTVGLQLAVVISRFL